VIEFPAIHTLVAEAPHDDMLRILRSRFGVFPRDLEQEIRRVTDSEKLGSMVEWMVRCDSLDEFRQWLAGGDGRSNSADAASD